MVIECGVMILCVHGVYTMCSWVVVCYVYGGVVMLLHYIVGYGIVSPVCGPACCCLCRVCIHICVLQV